MPIEFDGLSSEQRRYMDAQERFMRIQDSPEFKAASEINKAALDAYSYNDIKKFNELEDHFHNLVEPLGYFDAEKELLDSRIALLKWGGERLLKMLSDMSEVYDSGYGYDEDEFSTQEWVAVLANSFLMIPGVD